MASAGPNSPSTATTDSSVGTITWTNPTNVTSSNNVRARMTLSGSPPKYSYYLVSSGFGFSIDGGATIDGIVVEVERRSVASSASARDYRIRIVKGGVIGSTDKSSASNYPSTEAYATYGGSSDLWGETWSASDINASDFGFAIASEIFFDPGFGEAVDIDHIRITVYYTAGGKAKPHHRRRASRALLRM